MVIRSEKKKASLLKGTRASIELSSGYPRPLRPLLLPVRSTGRRRLDHRPPRREETASQSRARHSGYLQDNNLFIDGLEAIADRCFPAIFSHQVHRYRSFTYTYSRFRLRDASRLIIASIRVADL
jgi:hypothetical protein